jgi:E3 ubiquitin-protein ligase HUWE1
MDSGGVTREWFSTLSTAICRGSPDLFWLGGSGASQLYINPLATSAAHLKKYHFIGSFMAKALMESAARKDLGTVTLNLQFAEPLWKLMLGVPLTLMDLQVLDPTEFRSLMQMLEMDVDGLIFEQFVWNFQHPTGMASVDIDPAPGTPGLASTSSNLASSINNNSFSPFSQSHESLQTCIPLKPGGAHMRVTDRNKREYVLLKANKMLLAAVEQQVTAMMDAFYQLIPRDLVEKYKFSPLELRHLVCGERAIDVEELKTCCKYQDGYTGKEEVITWFWQVVEALDDEHRRLLLQFWTGSDGMPVEGFASLEPGFQIIAVARVYDKADKTARLPAAHTCFRQLDLPRYANLAEVREKLTTAITFGQGYMALS